MADVALITGASSGLGAELARLFAADRCDLVLVARRRDRLEALAAELEAAHGTETQVIVADLSDAAGVASVLAEVERLGLAITYLVNNAGFGARGAFVTSEQARQLAMVSLNVAAPLALTRALLPAMAARGRGRILMVSSAAGFAPGPYMATYHASKAFLNSFGEALSAELHKTGVTVTVSCPGRTATEFAAVAGERPGLLERLAPGAPASAVAGEAYKAMMAGRPLIVHGRANRAGIALLRAAPRSTVRGCHGPDQPSSRKVLTAQQGRCTSLWPAGVRYQNLRVECHLVGSPSTTASRAAPAARSRTLGAGRRPPFVFVNPMVDHRDSREAVHLQLVLRGGLASLPVPLGEAQIVASR